MERLHLPLWKRALCWVMGLGSLSFGLAALLGFVEIDRPRYRHRMLYDLLGPDGLAVFITIFGILFVAAMILVELRLHRARRRP